MKQSDRIHKLIIYTMYYSLFKELLHPKTTPDNYETIHTIVMRKCFGVFCTVKRYIHAKTEWPHNVHGCIGFWDGNFNAVSSQTLYNKLLQVSYDAMHTDSRAKEFPGLHLDPQSILEIDFMMKPVYKINPENGVIAIKTSRKTLSKQSRVLKTLKKTKPIPFDNHKFGIIIQSIDQPTKKATFLPGVFLNTQWNIILENIRGKSGIQDNEPYCLYAYKIKQYTGHYIELLNSADLMHSLCKTFSHFLIENSNMKRQYPFIYRIEKNDVFWDDTQQVRNIATIAQVYQYSKRDDVYNTIQTILQNPKDTSPQALSFLGNYVDEHTRPLFCKLLTERLKHTDIDQEFEKPEILIGILHADCTPTPTVSDYSFTENTSVFFMNWAIQVMYTYKTIPTKSNIKMFFRTLQQIRDNFDAFETNHIAVALEGACFLQNIVPESNDKNKLLTLIFFFWVELQRKRKHPQYPVFVFKDKSARIDISGHIYNGLYHLMLKNYFVQNNKNTIMDT